MSRETSFEKIRENPYISTMFTIAVICGGPSPERGISLNSARSILDHLSREDIKILPLYVDMHREFYQISPAQLYSNTPSDFDFKLSKNALEKEELVQFLRSVDLVFPVIHGEFGEDGTLQALLEELKVPFVGSCSQSCQKMYDKHAAKMALEGWGFPVLPSIVIDRLDRARIEHFFTEHEKGVVKPVLGGSSIGVFQVSTSAEAIDKCEHLFQKGHERVMLEAFCQGKEFTVIVMEGVALIPTEIEINGEQIFDYRRKYLPTNQVVYHTPPRFEFEEIRKQAEQLFKLFEMNDFVRIDGWALEDGTLYFTDINPLSGLEQNSFFFRQASMVGFTHAESLVHLVKSASRRFGLHFSIKKQENEKDRLPVFVLFGGTNAERQVSLMSGTNVWLKLIHSNHFVPTPFFYDCQGDIWELPYRYALDHTVEEIYHNCKNVREVAQVVEIQRRLSIEQREFKYPQVQTLTQFVQRAQEQLAFIFIAMHGGIGEDGTLQALLEKYQIPFNGSDAETSALGMDKYLSGERIRGLGDDCLVSLPKRSCTLEEIGCEGFWEQLSLEFLVDKLIIKPRRDGCSAGIVLLRNEEDLLTYHRFVKEGSAVIPAGSFANQGDAVELARWDKFLIEPYIETDTIIIENKGLKHETKTGWIELTVGVLEEDGNYHAFNPSITIAEGAVLSLEEKFQGGTGVNLTPPPEEILSARLVEKIRRGIEKIARVLGIRNYARIDIFFNRNTEQMIFIEVNTLPGLTPSTVFYHQGLAEVEALGPTALLERIIGGRMNMQLRLNLSC